MKDVSNKTIVGLLLVALVITVVGTLVSIEKLGGQYAQLSGAATGTGTTSLEVEAGAGININDSTASFGSGYVSPGNDSAYVYTNGTFNGSWTNTSTNATNGWIEIFNLGNVNVNLSVTSDKSNSEVWLCGTSCAATNVATLEVLAEEFEVGSCSDFNISNTFANTTFQTVLNTTANNTVNLCEYLKNTDATDDLKISFRAIVPKDATIGGHVTTLTFTATSIGSQG